MLLAEGFDLDIHARWKIELHQRVHRLLRRLENIEQALMRADLELLPRFLVDVRRTQHAIFVLDRRQRDRTGDLRASTLGRVHDLTCRLIKYAIVVRFQPDADSVFSIHVRCSSKNWRLVACRKIFIVILRRLLLAPKDLGSPRDRAAFFAAR